METEIISPTHNAAVWILHISVIFFGVVLVKLHTEGHIQKKDMLII